jgi:hypothetical protein
MQQLTKLLSNPKLSEFYVETANDLYQRLDNTPNTIISLQYDPDNFLSFKVYEASEGVIVRQRIGAIAIQCQIRGKTYKLTREHLSQLSNRERCELFGHLGVNDSQFS